MIPDEVIIFVGIFLGCLFRTLAPFIRIQRETTFPLTKLSWNHVYTVTFLTSLLIAFASALMGLTFFVMPLDPLTPLKLFAVSFVYGVGMNGVINEVASWFGAK